MNEYKTLVVDPPWQFNRQSKAVKPRYNLMQLEQIKQLPIQDLAHLNSHLYLWVPNALISDGISVMQSWGFQYKTMMIWAKHQMGVGNYLRNSTEPILFGVKGHLPVLRRNVRTWFLADRRQHSRKPDEFYRLVESVSPGPRIDIFSREKRNGWDQWGDQCDFFKLNNTGELSDERTTTTQTTGSSPDTGGINSDALRLDECSEGPVSEGGETSSI